MKSSNLTVKMPSTCWSQTRLIIEELSKSWLWNFTLSWPWSTRNSSELCIPTSKLPMPDEEHTWETHDDVIKWKHFPRCWPSVQGIHRSAVNHPHKTSDADLWYFLWSAPWINNWVNNREAGDLRRHRAHYDVIVVSEIHMSVFGDSIRHTKQLNTFQQS